MYSIISVSVFLRSLKKVTIQGLEKCVKTMSERKKN